MNLSLRNKNGFGKICPEQVGRGLLSNVVHYYIILLLEEVCRGPW